MLLGFFDSKALSVISYNKSVHGIVTKVENGSYLLEQVLYEPKMFGLGDGSGSKGAP